MPFCFNLENYTHFDFKDSTLEYLNERECPLCNKKHKIKFHCFVVRKSFKNKSLYDIKVIKIICENNYNIRKNTGEKLSYTLTILPGFIQPYARRTTDSIVTTANKYINDEIKTQQEAAFSMGVENTKSFSLYFNRIVNRLDNWTINLLQKISELTGVNNYDRKPYEPITLKQKWSYFENLVHEYCDIVETLPSEMLLLKNNRVCFIFAIFSQSIKSLGP